MDSRKKLSRRNQGSVLILVGRLLSFTGYIEEKPRIENGKNADS